jgi:hypothetical protein
MREDIIPLPVLTLPTREVEDDVLGRCSGRLRTKLSQSTVDRKIERGGENREEILCTKVDFSGDFGVVV